ncbi:MAG: HD domain-containing protein [Bacteroidales bacterium]|nr:HD domain-containing protein [Bacteroidales bacterium]
MTQNKGLQEENESLIHQIEELTKEVDRYKKILYKEKILAEEKKFKSKKIKKYRIATVLFADIQGFNDISEAKNSEVLVDHLDEIFIELETIIKKYNIIQIKSIRDSIMCVGGIPEKNITNPLEVVLIAIEMQYHLKELQRSFGGDKFWSLRIGIHTGPLVAQDFGKNKNNIKITGETVNQATRLRSFCSPGETLISETTYIMIKDLIDCEYYGKMPVKYKGDLQLYNIKGIKTEFSLLNKRLIPNKKFNIRFGLLQFTDLEELILDKLEKELPNSLYYHNVKHTVDVVTQAELIGLGEGVSEEELLLLKTAALFHDAGQIYTYDKHEEAGAAMAREVLPDYYYTPSQIDKICELIMSTQQPPDPRNKLEEIMCDADLDYLGRSDMIPVSNTLYKELKEHNKIASMEEWNMLQIKFISNHQYFTKTARSMREVNKQMQIERIKTLLVEA